MSEYQEYLEYMDDYNSRFEKVIFSDEDFLLLIHAFGESGSDSTRTKMMDKLKQIKDIFRGKELLKLYKE